MPATLISKFLTFEPLVLEHQVRAVITKQAMDGWPFDEVLAKDTIGVIEERQGELSDRILPLLRKVCERGEVVNKPHRSRSQTALVKAPFKKNGDFTALVKKWYPDTYEQVGGPFCKVADELLYTNPVVAWYPEAEDRDKVWGPFTRITFRPPKLNSPQEVKSLLLEMGWKPSEWNYSKDKAKRKIKKDSPLGLEKDAEGKIKWELQVKGDLYIRSSPQLTEDSYDSLTGKLGQDVATFLKYKHRLGLINGLMEKKRPDGRLSGEANTIGTPTYRFKHRIITNIPSADEETLMGYECRALFCAEPGRVIVGHDAANLEACMEAHETQPIDPEYANELMHGDQHMKNARNWGLVELYNGDEKKARKIAKSGKYALTYGAYPPKLARTLGIPKKQAQHLFNSFWSDDNPLFVLKRKLAWHFNTFGFFRSSLDGRVIVPRKETDLLNYCFQSDGAIVMKRSIIILELAKHRAGLDAYKVVDMHDEGQSSVLEAHADQFGELAVQSITKAGEYYNLNVPLTGEYKVGRNWAETH